MNYTDIKERLFVKLIPEWDRCELKEKLFGDISAVPAFTTEDGWTEAVTKKMLEEWNMSREDVMQDALAGIHGKKYEIAKYFTSHDGEVKLPVVSAEDGKYGSCILLCEEKLAELREEIGQDFSIVPLSVHQMLCIKNVDFESGYAAAILGLIAQSDPMDPSYLSMQIFKYKSDLGGLCIQQDDGTFERVNE